MPPSPTESETADEWREMCRRHDARTQAPSLVVGPQFGLDSPEPQPWLRTAPRSPSSSGEDSALEEYRRVCAQATRKRPISDTLAHEAPGVWSPPGSPSEPEPELGHGWQEGALRAFPSVMVPMPRQEASAPALTEVQWRPALESGAFPNHGWAGMFTPPRGLPALGWQGHLTPQRTPLSS